MSLEYASPTHSARTSSPRAPQATPQTQASTSKLTLDTSIQALTPPPTLREILRAYASNGQGDQEMLIALLNAKAAEEQRIAAVAALQQSVLQMQMTVAAAQLQAQSQSNHPTRGESQPKSPVSPSPRSKRKYSPVRGRSEMSPLTLDPRAKAHPYAVPRSVRREDVSWAPRRSWGSISDERSTSEDGASGRE